MTAIRVQHNRMDDQSTAVTAFEDSVALVITESSRLPDTIARPPTQATSPSARPQLVDFDRRRASALGLRGMRPLKLVTLSAVLSVLSGCQVFQPYVIPAHFNEPVRPGGAFCNRAPSSVETDEVAYARSIERQLSCFARQHAEFAAATGYTLIPLAALVAYQGFKPANPHNVAALSTAGFAAYGIASYQYKPRDAIYLAGVAAVDCAIQISAPSILSDAQKSNVEKHYTDFNEKSASALQDIEQASDHLAKANRALGNARAERQAVPVNNGNQDSRTALDTALTKSTAAAKTIGNRLVSTINVIAKLPKRYATAMAQDARARKDLAATSESIANAVNSQIATTTPDPASLAAKLSTLKLPSTTPQSAPTDTPALANTPILLAGANSPAAFNAKIRAFAGGPATDPQAAVLDSLQTASQELAKADALLTSAMMIAAPLLGDLDAAASVSNLEKLYKDCAIDVKVQTPLSIAEPADGVNVQNGGEAVNLPITGGSKPYSPVVMNPPAKGTLSLNIMQGVGNSSVLSMQAKNFDAETSLSVIVQDDAGGSTLLNATIKVGK